jgi:nucleoside 2-deoxyribosyltransferase
MKVYLSGQILSGEEFHYSQQWREWAEEICSKWGFTPVNPIADRLSNDSAYRSLIPDRDLMLLRDCDIMVVNWIDKRHSVGTAMEMVYAKLYDIPCIVFADAAVDVADLDDNTWIQHHNSCNFVRQFTLENFEDVLDWFSHTTTTVNTTPTKNGHPKGPSAW